MRAVSAALVALSLLLAACGGGGATSADDPTEGTDPATSEDAVAADLVATFGGDAQLEGGCDWLEPVPGEPAPDGSERYTPAWPEGYTVEFEPTRLIGPDGEVVAEQGDTLRLEGTIAADVATTCMIGPVFTVERILSVS